MAEQYESGFKTTLSTKLSSGDTTVNVATAPTVTSGRIFLKSGETKEWISFTGVTGTQLTGCTRQLSSTAVPTTSGGSGYDWIAGTEVRIVAMHDQLPNRQSDNDFNGDVEVEDLTVNGDQTNTSATYTQSISGSDWRIRKDGNDMKFRDDNTPEVTLTTLAGSSGADQKVSVSATDTTTGVLDDKLTAGDGLSKTIINPAGAEELDLDIDLTDTTKFIDTPGTDSRAVLTDSNGSLINFSYILGDGSDGALVVASGTTNINMDQVYNYSSISISGGVTLTTGAASGEIMKLKCLGLCTIDGTISTAEKQATSGIDSQLLGIEVDLADIGSAGNGGAGGPSDDTSGGTGGTGTSGYGGGGGGGAAEWSLGTVGIAGGNGGNGGTPGGSGGVSKTTNGVGNNGGLSSGGSGAASVSTGTGSSGAGGDAYGSDGGNASVTSGTNLTFGGGGGAGGQPGVSGANIMIYAKTFAGSGEILSRGANGTDGGNGGDFDAGGYAGGGGGGGGGAGGISGSQLLVGITASFSGTTNTASTGGSGGTGAANSGAVGGNAGDGGNGTGSTPNVTNTLLSDLM